ncbi:VanZ family protein [bacterium]|nr:VanZ family protein [bacterium]
MLQYLRKHKFLLLFILYSIMIWVLSSLTKPELPIKFSGIDKVIHILEFMVLGFLGIFAYRETWTGKNSKLSITVSFIVCSSYGAIDELHQYFILGRNASFNDFLADTLGVGLGIIIAIIIDRSR